MIQIFYEGITVPVNHHKIVATAPLPMRIEFVTCVSDIATLQKQLLRSPCLQSGGYPLHAVFNAANAAQAFNRLANLANVDWLVWVHQDVFLPETWMQQFTEELHYATEQWPDLAVAGVYGVSGRGADVRRAGHVLDRGTLLKHEQALPCLAESLDELLLAVRPSSGLQMDPRLGYDFYGTDLVLQAQNKGLNSVVIDAYCEHWSDTSSTSRPSERLKNRLIASAQVFEDKWRHRLPIKTSCFHIDRPGDVQKFLENL